MSVGWTNVLASLFWVRQFQICSDIFLEKYTCATVDAHQQILKSLVDILNINDLVSSLCVCEIRKHEVWLSQMSDPNILGSDKCQNGRIMSEC